MQQSDWAQEAHAWFHSYHDAILSNQDVSAFFDELIVDDALYESFRKHPLLGDIDLRNWQSSPFELLEQARGWKPFLMRLPKVPDNRLLTLARRNLLLPIGDPANQTLLSRQHWVLLEGLRWKEGLYSDPEVLEKLRDNPRSKQQKEGKNNTQTPYLTEKSNRLEVKRSESAGRFVCWKGSKTAEPGDIVLEAKPFVVASYDFEGAGAACFHCGSATKPNVVRNLALQCKDCQIWSFCSMACKQENAKVHALECRNVTKLFDKCESIGMPQFKALLVLRAALKGENFNDEADRKQWDQIMELECHEDEHRRLNAKYAQQAEEVANFMVQEKMVQQTGALTLTRLFFAININAIGLGANGAAGLFPGIPSMFNHSCNENLTHGWDTDGVLRFRAVEKIPPGLECCISYVTNLEAPTAERTAPLLQFKFFTCKCSRCRSSDEEGRAEAVSEWKSCMEGLQEETGDSTKLYRRLVELSEVIFPTYFVTKGWGLEECAHAMQQHTSLQGDYLPLLHAAREQYRICRGESSALVERVDEAIAKFTTETTGSSCIAIEQNEDDDSVGDADLILASGWNRTLLEVKPYDSEDDLRQLAEQIKSTFQDTGTVRWMESFRIYEIGFGIKTLILACDINESEKDKEIFAEEITDRFEDLVQNVDIVDVQDYS